MSQKLPWGSPSQHSSSSSGRRGLPPISTASPSSSRIGGAPSVISPTRATTHSPVASTTSSVRRQSASRQSSTSSLASPFSPTYPGSQQQQPGQLLSSARARTIPPPTNPQSAPFALALPPSGGTAAGGGTAKLARASPSLSQSSGIGSPSSSANPTSNPQSLTKIVIAQVFLLISSLKEEDKAKWESQAEQLRKLIEANGMEVFTKYFRRLLQNNAGQIFPRLGRTSENPSSYSILVGEVRKIADDPEQAFKIAESLDTPEGDLFKDFDLQTFVDHFALPDHAKINLALAVKSTASKADLRAKGT